MKIPSSIKPRDTYVDRIRPYIGKNLIKVLSGQRRVGKSYLLYQLMQLILEEQPGTNLIYINKEDLQFDHIQTAKDLNDYVTSQLKPTTRNAIFIDEIQDIQDFEKALHSLLLDELNDLYITGNNAHMLSGELATYLSGRYIEFNIYSLSYNEFLFFHQLADNNESLELYIKYGGLPYLINLALNDHVFDYLTSVYFTIIYRDVVSRYAIRNTQFLESWFHFWQIISAACFRLNASATF